MTERSKSRRARWVITAACLGALAFVLTRKPESSALVVYCAHDAVFAEDVLRDFERQSGIRLHVRYDTEATKSLGFVNLLVSERRHPECDVFWNNELLGTLELARQDLLEPYSGPGAARIPDSYKDSRGLWTGFAARLRVEIVNSGRVGNPEGALETRWSSSGDLQRVAMAQPLYGTTLTHYSLLWDRWGPDRLKAWHRDARNRGLREVAGNAAVKNLVAEGACDMGYTDTDDYFVARDDGAPVTMSPVRVDGETICIPNTVAILRGSRRLDAARQLVDFLLSESVELRLARSPSRQIPLGPVDSDALPAEVRPLSVWARDGADLRPLLPARSDVIDWLKSELLR
jgi:iron(III) transport system substrate-binding protein